MKILSKERREKFEEQAALGYDRAKQKLVIDNALREEAHNHDIREKYLVAMKFITRCGLQNEYREYKRKYFLEKKIFEAKCQSE